MKSIFRIFGQQAADDAKPEASQPSTGSEEKSTAPFTPIEGTTRPLVTEDSPDFLNTHLVYAQASDVGITRNINQDSAVSFFTTLSSAENRPDFGIFIIADGMGGHHDGEKASAVAARTVVGDLVRRIYLSVLNDEDDRPPVTEVLNDAVIRANREVLRLVPDGGTTITAVVIVNDLAYIGHVGDSRAYIIHKSIPEQITRDHSYVQRLYELGQIDQNDLEQHIQKNVLYRALGQNDLQEVDIITRRLPPASTLLLCSDGLWGQVKDSDIVHILNESVDPQFACSELIAAANRAGGIDNVSVIVVRIPA